MMTEEQRYISDDVIDLRELFLVLKKRKKLIIATTLLITTLAALYAYVIAKPVYEAKAMIQLGEIDGEPIEKLGDVKAKLSYRYKINDRKVKLPKIKSITIPKNSKSVFALTSHGYSQEDAKKTIQKTVGEINKEYKEKTDVYVSNQKMMIKEIDSEMKQNEKRLSEMQKKIADYSNKIITLEHEDAALAGIYAMQIGQKQRQLLDMIKYISDLKSKKQELELSISPVKIKPTQVVGDIESLEDPVKPKKVLIVIVASITGVLFAVFLAFFMEFIANLRNESTAK